MCERYAYVVMMSNDGDYDHYEEWSDRIFEDIDDAVAYIIDELGCQVVSADTLFFKRRFAHGSMERAHNECSQENGGQSVWIDKRIFVPNEWAREKAQFEQYGTATWAV